MKKTEKLLYLFWLLWKNEKVQKQPFCAEAGISSRTFGRYVHDIRTFLIEYSVGKILTYDSEKDFYFLE